MFLVANLVENTDKSKYPYSGYKIAFNAAGAWRFGYYFAQNVAFFGDDNGSSHPDNCKKYFLCVLGEGPTGDINGNVAAAEQKFRINFT